MAHGQQIGSVPTDNNSVKDFGETAGGASLKTIAEQVRNNILSFNEYKDSNGKRYGTTHPNSQSNGDTHGRGDVGQGIGTSTDISERKTLQYSSGNKYTPKKGYNGN